jgi:predicted Zn-ribbon and HTH transcriptional regulator
MEPTLKTLKADLEAIRDRAMNALKQIERPQEQYSMRWKCKACRYIKHFTRPVPLEAAGRCPRCKSTELRAKEAWLRLSFQSDYRPAGAKVEVNTNAIADNLSKAGWSWGSVASVDREGRTTWIADAHRGDV